MYEPALLLMSLLGLCLGAGAYRVDGDLADWGIDLARPLERQIPLSPWTDWVVEDNAADRLERPSAGPGGLPPRTLRFVGPGWSPLNFPDAEALYFDNDRSRVYFALITGLPPGGWRGIRPGDLGLDLDGDGRYELAVDLRRGLLLRAERWEEVRVPMNQESGPWKVAEGSVIRPVQVAWSRVGEHWVTEGALPLSALGLRPGERRCLRLHWTTESGDDCLELTACLDFFDPLSPVWASPHVLPRGVAGGTSHRSSGDPPASQPSSGQALFGSYAGAPSAGPAPPLGHPLPPSLLEEPAFPSSWPAAGEQRTAADAATSSRPGSPGRGKAPLPSAGPQGDGVGGSSGPFDSSGSFPHPPTPSSPSPTNPDPQTPEPATALLAGVGVAVVLLRRRP